MIKKRFPGLEAESHAGAVQFGENIVGEIGDAVEIHHAFKNVPVIAASPKRGLSFVGAGHQRFGIVPGAHQAMEKRIKITTGEISRQPVHGVPFLAGGDFFRSHGKKGIPQGNWDHPERSPHQGPDRGRNLPEGGPKVAAADITVIAAEKFVAAVSGKRHGDVAPRKSGNQPCGNLRRIGKGLVVHFGQPGNDLPRLGGSDDEFGMVGAQVIGDTPGILGLVDGIVFKADGEGLNRPGTLRLHHGNDG